MLVISDKINRSQWGYSTSLLCHRQPTWLLLGPQVSHIAAALTSFSIYHKESIYHPRCFFFGSSKRGHLFVGLRNALRKATGLSSAARPRFENVQKFTRYVQSQCFANKNYCRRRWIMKNTYKQHNITIIKNIYK